MSAQIGVIGMAVMGQNIALNMAEKGLQVAVFNRTLSKVDATVERASREKISTLQGFKDLSSFVAALKKPRIVLLMVEAGAAVEKVLGNVAPLLEKGDVIIDGGNEWFENTQRRCKEMEVLGLHYMGMGVSGGEEGARHGPALMPGGSKEGFEIAESIIRLTAAKVDGQPCTSYIGPGGAGHYVKMVHNGIEYGDMQVIAEAYDILKCVGGLTNEELKAVFRYVNSFNMPWFWLSQWNSSNLHSYLIEITANIFGQEDPRNPAQMLVDNILDVAGAKGTGSWTVQESAKRGAPCPTIQAALAMRQLSALKEQRKEACNLYYAKDKITAPTVNKQTLVGRPGLEKEIAFLQNK